MLENGATWHPSVLPYGQINCVLCNCKDGLTDCKRKDCPALSSRDKVQDKEACCPRCAVTGAEVSNAFGMDLVSHIVLSHILGYKKKLQ